jgi:branched-chain amino acid transport system permease protein
MGPGRIPAVAREWLMTRRWVLPLLLAAGLSLSVAVPRYELTDRYVQMIAMYVGINIILAASLNLVNGYMGEFSLGSAGFMAVGAYTASVLTVRVLPPLLSPLASPEALPGLLQLFFPLAVLAGGLAAAILGLLVAIPSFRTRGDYLALVSLAFLMIVKSVIENIDWLGGPRGFLGMKKLTSLPAVFAWTVVSVWIIRNFVYSRYGRGVLSIREDEIAADLVSVDTRRVKFLAFSLSAFFTGVAGALFAHLLLFINPKSFDIIRTTDVLIMVYLGGIASVGGSILGASLFTVLLEVLRPTAVKAFFAWLPAGLFTWLEPRVFDRMNMWRMVILPLALVLVMLYWPRGIMGLSECRWFVPREDLPAADRGGDREDGHGPP